MSASKENDGGEEEEVSSGSGSPVPEAGPSVGSHPCSDQMTLRRVQAYAAAAAGSDASDGDAEAFEEEAEFSAMMVIVMRDSDTIINKIRDYTALVAESMRNKPDGMCELIDTKFDDLVQMLLSLGLTVRGFAAEARDRDVILHNDLLQDDLTAAQEKVQQLQQELQTAVQQREQLEEESRNQLAAMRTQYEKEMKQQADQVVDRTREWFAGVGLKRKRNGSDSHEDVAHDDE